jgi:hypothetical protein
MLEKIKGTPKFTHLEQHMKRLLVKTEASFGDNKIDYVLYLAFLLTSEDFSQSIWNIDKSIQLLLQKIGGFWIGPVANEGEDALKRDVIRYFVLNALRTYHDNPEISQKIPKLKGFIQSSTMDLNKSLTNLQLTIIFNHNMDFALPRTDPLTLHTLKACVAVPSTQVSALFGFVYTQRLSKNFLIDTLAANQLGLADLSITQRVLAILNILQLDFLVGAVAFRFSFKYMNTLINALHSVNQTRWQEMDRRAFHNFCRQHPKLSGLLYKTGLQSTEDDLWRRPSRLCRPEKGPFSLKLQVQQQLQQLQAELGHQKKIELIKFLTCCLAAIPSGTVRDLGRNSALDMLRKPSQSWGEEDTSSEMKTLLQCYVKLAYIDFIKQLSENRSRSLNQYLGTINDECREIIDKLEAKGVRSSMVDFALVKDTLYDIAVISIIALGFRFNVANVVHLYRGAYLEPEEMLRALLTLKGIILGLLKGCIGAPPIAIAVLLRIVMPLYVNRGFDHFKAARENIAGTTMFFHTREVLNNNRELKDILEDCNNVLGRL